jgi:hypothetical protein
MLARVSVAVHLQVPPGKHQAELFAEIFKLKRAVLYRGMGYQKLRRPA